MRLITNLYSQNIWFLQPPKHYPNCGIRHQVIMRHAAFLNTDLKQLDIQLILTQKSWGESTLRYYRLNKE